MVSMITEEEKKELVIQRIRQYRVERQWTLEQVAKMLDLTPSQVSRYEKGISKPNSLTLYRIEKQLPGILGDAA